MQITFSEGVDTLGFNRLNTPLSRQEGTPGVREVERSGFPDAFNASFDPGKHGNEQIQRDIKKAVSGGLGAGDVKNLSDYMTVVANTVSDEDYNRMLKEGFDPADIDPATGEGVLGAIKAAVLKGGKSVAGFNTDLSVEEVAEIAGSPAAARAIMKASEKYDVPVNEENVKGSAEALSIAGNLRPLTAGESAYMVLEGQSPAIGDLYKAENSGNALRPVDEDIEGAGLEADIEKIVKSAAEVSSEAYSGEEAMDYAREMVSYGVPLNEESLNEYIGLRTLVLPPDMQIAADAAVSAISDNRSAMSGNLADTRNNIMKAEDLLHNEAVLARARARMSSETNLILVRSGVSIDTDHMEKLADALEKAEKIRLSSLWGSDGEEAVSRDRIYKETLEAVDNIRSAPAALAGRLAFAGENAPVFTVSSASAEAVSLADTFRKMNETYEAVGTQVRTDLGDSMSKAFSNVGDILSDLGLEDNTANARAVRILGWNSTEITRESVFRVREADDMLNALVNKLTPGAALSLVRNGVDTLNTGIPELMEMIEAREGERGADYDSLGEFVYRMENSGSLADDEREALIGIFRLLNQIKKHDDRSVGGLLKSGRELTLGNLFSESKSLRAENKIDVSMGQDFRGSDHRTDNSIIEQIVRHTKAAASEITDISTPSGLLDIGLERISEMTPDLLLDTLKAGNFRYDTGKMENETLDRVAEQAARTGDELSEPSSEGPERNIWEEKVVSDMRSILTEEAIQEVFEKEMNAFGGVHTIFAAQALKGLRSDRSGYLKIAYENESGKGPDSEGLLSALTGKEDAVRAEERLCDELEEKLDQRLASDDGITYLDIQALKAARRQVSVIRQLSREEDYEIPMEINGRLTGVNLKLIHGQQKGRVYVQAKPGEGAEISASFSLDGNKVSGYVVCVGEGYRERLEDAREQVLSGFSGDIEVIEAEEARPFRFDLKAAEEKETDGSGVPDAELYRLARNFLRALS